MNVRIGVIGCGRWGSHYLRTFDELPLSQVVAISDIDDKQLAQASQRHPQAAAFVEPEKVATSMDVDAVVVATPASTHYPLVAQALRAEKHVLVEKPFVLNIEDGQELVDLADQLRRVLMVGHVFIYNPGIRKLKEYMTPDQIGDVYYLYATRTNLGPIRQDVNVMWDLAPHDISIFSYLLEREPVYVAALGGRFLGTSREDVAFITLEYPGGVVGHVHVSWANPHRVREIAVVGSRMRLVFDDLNIQEHVRVYEKGVEWSGTDKEGFGDFILSMRDGAIVSPIVDPVEPLREQCLDFLRSIREGKTPLADGRQGLAAARVLEAAQRSAKVGGSKVPVIGS